MYSHFLHVFLRCTAGIGSIGGRFIHRPLPERLSFAWTKDAEKNKRESTYGRVVYSLGGKHKAPWEFCIPTKKPISRCKMNVNGFNGFEAEWCSSILVRPFFFFKLFWPRYGISKLLIFCDFFTLLQSRAPEKLLNWNFLMRTLQRTLSALIPFYRGFRVFRLRNEIFFLRFVVTKFSFLFPKLTIDHLVNQFIAVTFFQECFSERINK